MEQALIESAKQVPALVALIVLVITGIWAVRWLISAHMQSMSEHREALADRDKLFINHIEKRDETVKVMADSCHAVQRQSIDAMHDIRNSMNNNTKALERMTEQLQRK